MSRSGQRRAMVLGAGPMGLETALRACSLGLSVTVLERGRVGDGLLRFGSVRLFSPFGHLRTALGRETILRENPRQPLPQDTDALTAGEYVASYLEPLALTEPLCPILKTGVEVLHVGRVTGPRGDGWFRLLVREGPVERIEECDWVFDCTGQQDRPRWLGDGGIPAVGELAARSQMAFGVVDVLGQQRSHYAGRSVLVVGSGHSAATNVCQLADLAADHPETWVIWLTRVRCSQPVTRCPGDPLRERDRLAVRANSLATRGDGNVEFHPGVAIDAIRHEHGWFRISGRCGGQPRVWEAERLIACVGSVADSTWAGEVGGQPGYLVFGSKAGERGFLLRDGFEQMTETLTQRVRANGGRPLAGRSLGS